MMGVSFKMTTLFLLVCCALFMSVKSNSVPSSTQARFHDKRDNRLGRSIAEGIMHFSPETCYDGSDVIAKDCKWPAGVVVYDIEDVFSSYQLYVIMEAQKQITEATNSCITFRRKAANDTTYVSIMKRKQEMYTVPVGRRDGAQKMSLNDDCFGGYSETHWVTVMHMLSLGLWFEHGRQDRDEYIRVFEENIVEEALPLFKKINGTTYATPYDYDSILHVDEYFFSKNRKPVILPYDLFVDIGATGYMSKLDAVKLQTMYGCY